LDTLDQNTEAVEKGNELFPIFLKLQNFQTLLVGAGNVGLEKLEAMLNNSPDAKIIVVADNVLGTVHQLINKYPDVKLQERQFEENDLNGIQLLVLATDNKELHQYIRKIAKEKGILVNVADTPELCDFYLGSIVKKGNLKIAISTNGKSPTVGKRLKQVFNETIPEEIDDTLEQMNQLRNTLQGDFAHKVKKMNEATVGLVADKNYKKPPFKHLSFILWSIILVFVGITFSIFWFQEPVFKEYLININPHFYYFLIAGFVFAMIDGAIGMSYGVTSTTFSISMGIPPASASTAVHISEILSCGIAGWMHHRMGNINKKLFMLLVIPGIIGAVMGAYLLSSLEHYSMYTKPFISVYTLSLGILILSKAFNPFKRDKKLNNKITNIRTQGFFGGLIDAVGGGGWGSIVLSSLIAGGRNARTSLGTVKLSRFFISLLSSLTFIIMLNHTHWEAVGGLVLGSAIASPIAAKVSNKISAKTIMVSVGIIVIIVSLKSIITFGMKLLP
jgi:siroheme synthase-like protein